jgi:uncharacterized membrane protein (DUF373 family)
MKKHKKACETSKNCLEQDTYMIKTSELWLPSTFNKKWKEWAKKTVNNVLETIITKLIIAFWILSLFIMTVGWWYMIFSHGQDELLNKWKGIFTAWLTSLIIALSSWIIIKIVIYLLY